MRGGEPQLRTRYKGNGRITQCEYGKAPTRQLHSNTHCCLWSGHTRKQSNSWIAVIHKQESRHKVPESVLGAVLGRMQVTLHATRRTPHGASPLVQSNVCLVGETRPAPSRHSRDATVYGHTTTVMHKLSTPPPFPPPHPAPPFQPPAPPPPPLNNPALPSPVIRLTAYT